MADTHPVKPIFTIQQITTQLEGTHTMINRREFITRGVAAASALAIPGLLAAQTARGSRKAAESAANPAPGKSPVIKLNNGVEMPTLGFGTYRAFEATATSVDTALRAGYRLVDTAAFYGNEEQVGEGIRRSGVQRAELFVTTKLWMADYGQEQTIRAFDVSLKKLGLDYIDLYLLHYPAPRHFDDTVAAYHAAEKLLAEGKIRAIGVSNFSAEHLRRLAQQASTTPAVNQIEIHPYFIQRELRAANAALGIVTQAWSPIGGIFINHPKNGNGIIHLLRDPKIAALAERYGKTTAQIVLRWHIQNGVATIPKSVQADRIQSNLEVFDFELTPADMVSMDAIDRGLRGGTDPEIFDMDYMRARQQAAAKS